jgi:hypothetical protein
MGKLHTLRRAIERDPQAWYYQQWTTSRSYVNRVYPAARNHITGEWRVDKWSFDGSYKAFVRHVLIGLGIADVAE